MSAATKECLDAFHSGDKERVLKLLPRLRRPEAIRDCRRGWEGCTLFHHAAHHGWDDVWKLLLEKYRLDPTTVDDDGISPLHIACVHGQRAFVKYLLSLPSVVKTINDKDNEGYTPLHLACRNGNLDVVEILLGAGSVSVSEENDFGLTPIEMLRHYSYCMFSRLADKISWSAQLRVKYFFNVFLVGNTAAGKSTLAAVMVELARDTPTQHGRIGHVKELTAGMVPTQCRGEFQLRENKKTFGWIYGSRVTRHLSLCTNLEIYDLAGHCEFYSSHSAMLESLCLESPAVFVLVVDLTKPEDQLTKEIYKWANFLEIQSCGVPSRVVVVGSRRDKFSGKQKALEARCKFLERCVTDALENLCFAGFVALDTRQLSSENVRPFLELLARSVADLVDPSVHQRMSFGCHLLYAFLREKVKAKAVSFADLRRLVSGDEVLGRLSDPEELASMLEVLTDKGTLLFLRNGQSLPASCVVVDKIRLLHEVNGTIFAPPSFPGRQPLASNTGIVPLSHLEDRFEVYDREILVAFLTSLQFCRPVDPAVLGRVSTNLSSEMPVGDRLLYFPALVSVDRRGDVAVPDGFGWCVYCRNPRKCLTRRYSDSLFLDLAYSFCDSIPPPPEIESPDRAVLGKLDRSCIVWKNGIHWSTEDGFRIVVQVTEENRCVSFALSGEEKRSSKWLQLCSSLIDLVLSKKERLCPSVEFTEYLVPPSHLSLLSRRNLSQLTVFEMGNVARSALLRKKFVLDVSREERTSPASLIPDDPYLVLRPSLVHRLFDDERAREPVPAGVLREIRHHLADICPVPPNSTYCSMRKRLNGLSAFAGRNPLVLAGLKEEDLPYIPPLHDEEDDLLSSPITFSHCTIGKVVTPDGRVGVVHVSPIGGLTGEGGAPFVAQVSSESVELGLKETSFDLTCWPPSPMDIPALLEEELDPSYLDVIDRNLPCQADWRKLGAELGFASANLESISEEHSLEACKTAVLHQWLHSGRATKTNLLAALTVLRKNSFPIPVFNDV